MPHELTQNQFRLVLKEIDQADRERMHADAIVMHEAVGSNLAALFGKEGGRFKRFLGQLLDDQPGRMPSEGEMKMLGVKMDERKGGMSDWKPMNEDGE